MRIGIDLSAIQGGHRMRGIGSTLINFINHLSEEAKANNEFVFYVNQPYPNDPLECLNLKNVSYEVRPLKKVKNTDLVTFFAKPGQGGAFVKLSQYNTAKRIVNRFIYPPLRLVSRGVVFLRVAKGFCFGDSRIARTKDIDHFIQFDPNLPPPRRWVKSTVIIYDAIPYIMESEYLHTYKTARRLGYSRVISFIKYACRRIFYVCKVKLVALRAQNLVAISEHTKKDFVSLFGIKANKIHVSLLGANDNSTMDSSNLKEIKGYIDTSWGYMQRPIKLKGEKFLLFVGGADPRRRLIDLIAAFNNLRGRGVDIKLVLAGDTMKGAFNIPSVELKKYLRNTSYINDIFFVGFVDDKQRDWLYRNAVAFVYPSVYEGFGLPIIEAFQHSCPVICYKNSSIPEVANNAALYADNYLGIVSHVFKLMDDPGFKNKYVEKGLAQSKKFSWTATSDKIIKIISTQ